MRIFYFLLVLYWMLARVGSNTTVYSYQGSISSSETIIIPSSGVNRLFVKAWGAGGGGGTNTGGFGGGAGGYTQGSRVLAFSLHNVISFSLLALSLTISLSLSIAL